jgi:predicted transcriptional regulator
LRKKVLYVRFRKRNLARLSELAKRLGVPSRSRLVNLALEAFFDSFTEQTLTLEENLPVKILLDQPVKEKLGEIAERFRTPRAELVRIALKKFEQSQS